LFKNSQPFRKNYQKTSGGKIFWRTLYMSMRLNSTVGDCRR